jgi:hypothetical protein
MKLLQSRVIKTVSLSLVLQILSIFTLSDLASAGAQLSSSHGFLQGQYVEVGIRPNGAFGSSGSPSPIPAGYHATNAPCLGFRVDRSKDGWGVTTDDGDFFCPGTPYEEWMLNVGGSSLAYNSNSITSIAGSLSNANTTGSTHSITWTSTSNYQGITVQIINSIDEAGQALNTDVTLTNSSVNSINNIYFGRGVDPDNNTNPGIYNSTNTITGQGSSSFVKAVFSNGSLIGLRSTDSRARVARNASSFAAGTDPRTVWDAGEAQTASGAMLGNLASTSADAGMYLALKIPTLTAGATTSFRISYVLTLAESQIPSINSSASTNNATNLTSSSATLNGAVNANGLSTNTYFEISKSASFSDSTTVSSSILSNSIETNISASATGLSPSTTYYFRVRAVNSSGSSIGNTFSFNTYPTILIQPKNETTTATLTDTFTVNSTPLLAGQSRTIRWQFSSDTVTGTTWSNVVTGSGITTETFTTTSVTSSMNKYRFRAVLTFSDTSTTYSETSTAAVLTVNPVVTFTSDTSTIVRKYGSAATTRQVLFTGGTDTKTISVSSTSMEGGKITFDLSQRILFVDTSTFVGTYSETITVTDALGAVSSYVQLIQVNYADTITIQTDTQTAVVYNPSGQNFIPTNTVTGLVAGDSVLSLDYSYIGTGGNSYSSNLRPSSVGVYSINPTNLQLLNNLSLSNYHGVIYKSGSIAINKANQNPIYIGSTLGVFETTPSYLPLFTYGGNDTGTVSYLVLNGGTASNCSVSNSNLTVTSTGSCQLLAIKSGSANYLSVYSDTATITFLRFNSYQPVQTQSVPTQIPINGQNFFDISEQLTVPAITGVFLVGSTYEINGNGFTGVVRVIIGGTDVSITSSTANKIVVNSAGLVPGLLLIECSDGRIGPSPFYIFVP